MDGFADTGSTAWRTRAEALETVHESLGTDKGVLPDANSVGKPDIFMAKRAARS